MCYTDLFFACASPELLLGPVIPPSYIGLLGLGFYFIPSKILTNWVLLRGWKCAGVHCKKHAGTWGLASGPVNPFRPEGHTRRPSSTVTAGVCLWGSIMLLSCFFHTYPRAAGESCITYSSDDLYVKRTSEIKGIFFSLVCSVEPDLSLRQWFLFFSV